MKFSTARMKAQIAARRQIVSRLSLAAKERLMDGKSKHIEPCVISLEEFRKRFGEEKCAQVVMLVEYVGLLMGDRE